MTRARYEPNVDKDEPHVNIPVNDKPYEFRVGLFDIEDILDAFGGTIITHDLYITTRDKGKARAFLGETVRIVKNTNIESFHIALKGET